MRMGKLEDPSRELATRILTEVDFEDRLCGFSLRERSGPIPVTMYSFEEVVSLLNDLYPRLDFRELEGWIRSVMGDTELAEQIAQAVKKGNNDQERTYLIRDLIEERLNQCRAEGCLRDNTG
jgi:hypothetical protein